MYPDNVEQIRLLQAYSKPLDLLGAYEILKQSPEEYVTLLKKPYPLVVKLGSLHNDKIVNEAYVGLYGISQLQSSNFANVVQIGIESSCHNLFPLCNYVIYEYAPGMSFHDYLITQSEESVKIVLRDIFSALYYAYSKINFVHEDLHTNNIIIKPNGTPVIIDYGMSHFGDSKETWHTDVYSLLSYTIEMIEHLDEKNTAYSRKPKLEILQDRRSRSQSQHAWYSSKFLVSLQTLEGSLQAYSYEEFLQEIEAL